jgi:hypothetical protein
MVSSPGVTSCNTVKQLYSESHRAAKADGFALALPAHFFDWHPSSMGHLRGPCTASRTAIESACPWQTPMSFLLGSGLSAETPKTQLEMYIVAGSTGEKPELCLRTEQVYHEWGNSAIASPKHNGYQARTDAVICAVPPFLRTAEAGGFLEVSL